MERHAAQDSEGDVQDPGLPWTSTSKLFMHRWPKNSTLDMNLHCDLGIDGPIIWSGQWLNRGCVGSAVSPTGRCQDTERIGRSLIILISSEGRTEVVLTKASLQIADLISMPDAIKVGHPSALHASQGHLRVVFILLGNPQVNTIARRRDSVRPA